MKSKLNFPVFVILFLLLIDSALMAKTDPPSEYKLNDITIDKLIRGIQSEDKGVSRCCIYLAGKYRIRKALNPLILRLKNEKDPSQRVLIAIVLYKIGDPRGIFEIDRLAVQDDNSRVKKVCGAIYEEYLSSLGFK